MVSFFLFLTWRAIVQMHRVYGDERSRRTLRVSANVYGNGEWIQVASDLDNQGLPPEEKKYN